MSMPNPYSNTTKIPNPKTTKIPNPNPNPKLLNQQNKQKTTKIDFSSLIQHKTNIPNSSTKIVANTQMVENTQSAQTGVELTKKLYVLPDEFLQGGSYYIEKTFQNPDNKDTMSIALHPNTTSEFYKKIQQNRQLLKEKKDKQQMDMRYSSSIELD
jgi:hypothetical protein